MDTLTGERIKKLRDTKPLREIANITGVTPQYLSQIENGKREPSRDVLKKMAHAFNVTVSYLIGETDNPALSSLGPAAFHLTPSMSAGHISGEAQRPSDEIPEPSQPNKVQSNVITMNNALMIPVVTKDVSARCRKESMYAEDVRWEITGYYPMGPNDLLGYAWQTQEFCIIRADGDSMEPHIHVGDRILFAKSPDIEVESGDFAILLWDGKLLIRGVIFPDEQKVILRPTNKDYDDIETTRDDNRLCVLGKVLGVTPAYRKTPGLW